MRKKRGRKAKTKREDSGKSRLTYPPKVITVFVFALTSLGVRLLPALNLEPEEGEEVEEGDVEDQGDVGDAIMKEEEAEAEEEEEEEEGMVSSGDELDLSLIEPMPSPTSFGEE
jgi:hypothetical protein